MSTHARASRHLPLLDNMFDDMHAMMSQKELIEPAVNGTKNVLGAVAKNKSSVKRTVLTSSFAGRSFSTLTRSCCNNTQQPNDVVVWRYVMGGKHSGKISTSTVSLAAPAVP